MPVGGTLRAVITGGTPPYRTVVLDNCSTNAKIVQGNILQATATLACTGAAITVVDANNQTVSLNLTISAGTVGLQVAPSTFTVPENANTPDLSLLVYGANGPLQVFSTDTTVLAPQPLDPKRNPDADGVFTITLKGGNTCSLTVVQEVAAVPGVDNTVPKDGDFTDIAATPPVAGQMTSDQPPLAAVPGTGGERIITITVIDSTGRQGTSKMTVNDSDGKAGCSLMFLQG